jgi:hypothetical protein
LERNLIDINGRHERYSLNHKHVDAGATISFDM